MSHAAVHRSEPQRFLGRYRAVRELGSGGSGRVWLARDERSGRDVAVKIVPREGKAGSRARREAQAMAALDHEHCLRVYACGRDADNVYIVYEFVPGRTFREALRRGEVTDEVAVDVAVQVLDALAHVHAHGIVHRDVKPANVLLADTGDRSSIRLLDFGLARVAEAETLTAAGDVPGTLAYIAPERLSGEDAGAAADVWSVGVLLHEALAGRHPFWRPSLAETADAIAGGARPLRSERPDLSPQLQAAVDAALALDPARRPSAARLAKLLRRARGDRVARLAPLLGGVERRVVPAVLAGVYAAVGASLLPFYPAHGAALLGVLAAATTAIDTRAGLGLALAVPVFPLGNVALALALLYLAATTAIDTRAGLALALAVPVFPLGNVALALALLYLAAAAAWFALFAAEPERGLLPALGPLLGPLAPALLPVVLVATRASYRRALGAAGGVALAAAVAAARSGPPGPDVEASRHPLAVAALLVRAAPHALVVELPLAACLAVVLPAAVRGARRFRDGGPGLRTYTR